MDRKLTVFMPVYNGEKYLKEAIDSVLNQTFKDFKFLIINDGSTDESVNIINSFNDERIQLVNNSKNEGLVYTRNKGLDLINTEFAAFADSDDISLPYRLEKELDFFNKKPDYGICNSNVEVFGKYNDGYWNYPEQYEDIKTWSLFKCLISNSSVMVRIDLFKKFNIRYIDGFYLAEDYELWTRALENIKAYTIQTPLARVRAHNESICHTRQDTLKQNVTDVYKLLLDKLGIAPSQDELNIHYCIGEYAPIQSINNYLEKTEQWLNKLIEGNNSTCVYNHNNFNIMIDKIWFETCNYFIKNHSGCWNKYNNPIFKKNLKFNKSHKRKIFLRSINKNSKLFLNDFFMFDS